MRKLWWPEPLYEIKPFGAMGLGLLTALLGSARSWTTQSWGATFVLALVAGLAFVAYATVILLMRHRYRRRSRWNRERWY